MVDERLSRLEAKLGQPIPSDTPHAVSVTLPSWRSNVGYEEGEDWVVSKMTTGYPRFFIHKIISALADQIVDKYAGVDEQAMLFPTFQAATRCLAFMQARSPTNRLTAPFCRIFRLETRPDTQDPDVPKDLELVVVIYPKDRHNHAKQFWQHSGEGVSSRRAEYCKALFEKGYMVSASEADHIRSLSKGPKRYRNKEEMQSRLQKPSLADAERQNGHSEIDSSLQFVEERFGRNFNMKLAENAKKVLRRRISGSLLVDKDLDEALQNDSETQSIREVHGLSEDDVYLYPGGMNAIYNAHRTLLAARSDMKSICFGFPYIDTLKILEKIGPGCLFYGHGSSQDLDDLEKRLESGERYLALFCEFPSNPVLRTPDLHRIRSLADKYDFAVIVDETIGNFLNVHVLPLADIVVSSLTKIFSGDSNVMGGSAILNPTGQYYELLKNTYAREYQDTYWPEDAVFMERNSRDFVSRSERVNKNAEAICEVLQSHPRVKQVHYPKVSPSRPNFDACRTPNGGYGGLLSATFHSMQEAAAFYDALDSEKGPSLGTNFTLSSPFVILAHYTELEWAAQFGVESNLVRFSVGLEDTVVLLDRFKKALEALLP